MKSTVALSLLLITAMITAQGCTGRIISEGMEKGLGPTAFAHQMDPKFPRGDQNYLASYRNFELAAVKVEFLDTPQIFVSEFQQKFHDQLARKELPQDRRGKTLLVNVTILAYQSAESYHKVIGPTEEVVARVELTDKSTGSVIGRAICIGRTYQSVGLGPNWKARGLARAIVNDWIDPAYPKAGRKGANEDETE
jgi:hypothetical protein